MTSSFKDKAGQSLAPKDFIIQSKSLGRSPGLSYSIVVGQDEYRSYKSSQVRLLVIGMTSWGRDVQSKITRLQFGGRVLKLHEDQIPDEIKDKLLAKYSELVK